MGDPKSTLTPLTEKVDNLGILEREIGKPYTQPDLEKWWETKKRKFPIGLIKVKELDKVVQIFTEIFDFSKEVRGSANANANAGADPSNKEKLDANAEQDPETEKKKGFNITDVEYNSLKKKPEIIGTTSDFDRLYLGWLGTGQAPEYSEHEKKVIRNTLRSLFRFIFGSKKVKDVNKFHTKLRIAYTNLKVADKLPCGTGTVPVPVKTSSAKTPFAPFEPFCGIQGGKNACYMNSVIQMLWHMPEFREMIFTTNDKDNNVANALKNIFNNIKESIDASAFASVSASANARTPITKNKEDYNKLIEGSAQITAGNQEDVEEFLNGIFAKFEGKMNFTTYLLKLEYACRNTPENFIEQGKSEYYQILKLTLGNDHTNIQDLLNASTVDVNDKDEKVDSCIDTTNPDGFISKRKTTYGILEEMNYLIIQLVRFNTDGTKNNKSIEASPEVTIADEKGNETHRFKLRGCIRHSGDVGKGHYTYQSFNPLTLVDDSTVKPVTQNDNEAIKTEGYIYLYERVRGDSGASLSPSLSPSPTIDTSLWGHFKKSIEYREKSAKREMLEGRTLFGKINKYVENKEKLLAGLREVIFLLENDDNCIKYGDDPNIKEDIVINPEYARLLKVFRDFVRDRKSLGEKYTFNSLKKDFMETGKIPENEKELYEELLRELVWEECNEDLEQLGKVIEKLVGNIEKGKHDMDRMELQHALDLCSQKKKLLEECKKRIEDIQARLDASELEHTRLNDTKRELEEGIRVMGNEISRLQGEIEDAGVEKNSLRAVADEAHRDTEAAQRATEAAQRATEAAEQRAENARTAAEAAAQAAQVARDEAATQIQAARDESEASRIASEAALAAAAVRSVEADRQKEAAEEAAAAARAEAAAAEAARATAREEAEETSRRATNSNSAKDAALAEQARLASEKAAIEADLAASAANLAEKQQEILGITARLEETIATAEEEKTRILREKNSLAEEKERLEAANEEAEAARRQALSELERITRESEGAAAASVAALEGKEAAETLLAETKAAVAQATQAAQEAAAEAAQAAQAALQKSEEGKAQSNAEKVIAVSEKAAALAELAQKQEELLEVSRDAALISGLNAELMESVRRLEGDNAGLQDLIDRYEPKIIEMEGDAAGNKIAFTALRVYIKQLKEELNRAQKVAGWALGERNSALANIQALRNSEVEAEATAAPEEPEAKPAPEEPEAKPEPEEPEAKPQPTEANPFTRKEFELEEINKKLEVAMRKVISSKELLLEIIGEYPQYNQKVILKAILDTCLSIERSTGSDTIEKYMKINKFIYPTGKSYSPTIDVSDPRPLYKQLLTKPNGYMYKIENKNLDIRVEIRENENNKIINYLADAIIDYCKHIPAIENIKKFKDNMISFLTDDSKIRYSKSEGKNIIEEIIEKTRLTDLFSNTFKLHKIEEQKVAIMKELYAIRRPSELARAPHHLPPMASPATATASPTKPQYIPKPLKGGGQDEKSANFCKTMLILLLLQAKMDGKEFDVDKFMKKASTTISDLGQCPLVLETLRKLIDAANPEKKDVFQPFENADANADANAEEDPKEFEALSDAYNANFNEEESNTLKNLGPSYTFHPKVPEEFENVLGNRGYFLNIPDEVQEDNLHLNDDIEITHDERKILEKRGIPLGALRFLYLACLRKLQGEGEVSLDSMCVL